MITEIVFSEYAWLTGYRLVSFLITLGALGALMLHRKFSNWKPG